LTELARIDALCAAANRPLSLHCAPAIRAHAGCALGQFLRLEYFHDHRRIKEALSTGRSLLWTVRLAPDLTRARHGLSLRSEAERYTVS
jgi:hypothetical protein